MRTSMLAAVFVPACAAAVLVAGGTAVAAVSFDPATGHGFAGRKDVRTAFGWTTAELRDRAGAVSFAYVDRKEYRVACTAGERSETFEAHTAHEKQVLDRARREGRAVLGFDLLGYGGETSSTDLYQDEGQPCRGSDSEGGFNGVWGPVEQTSATLGLVVRHRAQEKLLT